ncbi:transposase [Adlercreutzia sp. ZJ154]|uniref:transposase n=1 Tax=Adlercreutzia sp. ZJ154 TaxID=2709790 RepID=UPI00210510F4|nr:transposase [Adlercreutzia sp. ZJ154]
MFWAVAYDAEDTCVLDIVNGKDSDAIQAFYDSISLSDKMRVRHFCCDMEDTYIAKDGCKHFTEARCQLQKGAGSGAGIKCMANKLVANRCRRLSHISASAYESEKKLIADTLCICDTQHAKLRLAYMALQLYYVWQDTTFETLDDMEHALNGLIGRISTIPIPQMKRFAKSLSKYKREILRGYFYNVNNAKAEALNRKIKDIKRITNGIHDFDVARKRILIALGREGATEGDSAYIIRKEKARAEYTLKNTH